MIILDRLLICFKYTFVFVPAVSSLLAEVSHDEAFLPRRERPLLAGKLCPANLSIP